MINALGRSGASHRNTLHRIANANRIERESSEVRHRSSSLYLPTLPPSIYLRLCLAKRLRAHLTRLGQTQSRQSRRCRRHRLRSRREKRSAAAAAALATKQAAIFLWTQVHYVCAYVCVCVRVCVRLSNRI